jgi:hypothetical protein
VLVKSRAKVVNFKGLKITFLPVSVDCIAAASALTDDALKGGLNPQTQEPWLESSDV